MSNPYPGPFIEVKNWIIPTGICENSSLNGNCPSKTLVDAVTRCQSIKNCDSIVKYNDTFNPTISTTKAGYRTPDTISYFLDLRQGINAIQQKLSFKNTPVQKIVQAISNSNPPIITTQTVDVNISNFDNTNENLYNEYYIIFFFILLIILLFNFKK